MAVQKVVTISLYLDYPDGVTKLVRQLLDNGLEKAFTPELRDSWWGMDAGPLPKSLIFASADDLVQAQNVFHPAGPQNVEARAAGGWATVGGLHEAKRSLWDTSIDAPWEVSIVDPATNAGYTAAVHAVYNVGIVKEFP